MTLQLLREVLSPPENVCEPGSAAQWPEIEAQLGISLPGDYKDYVNTFGSGLLGDLVLPLNPFSQNEYVNLVHYNGWRLDAYRKRKEKWGNDQCPYPLHPEPGGLLCWGRTEDGDTLLWRTAGDPAAWPVIVNPARSTQFEEFASSMTLFLRDWLKGNITSDVIGKVRTGVPLFAPVE